MTLRREPKTREIVFECDGLECPNEAATGADDFEEARSELRSERWSTRNQDGEWRHFCPDCMPPAVARPRYAED
ncbi:hypothetical protein JessAGP_026 [Caulobacter phage Jess A]|nr:hypothetical protein JessAGP_026 [Caulobacter phage Jess A]QNH91678.1 hypothetical protein SR18_gp027 [Caulobacter phage SR18]WCA46435.1 hypothetical protein [Caulobacter phage RapA]